MLAKEFLALNGVFKSEFVHPKDHKKITKKFDLIYSFASYPFHVLPEEYEDLLFKNSHDDTVFIFEVRRGYKLPLDIIKVIFEEPKYERVVACRPQ
jgi:hypothetical protein